MQKLRLHHSRWKLLLLNVTLNIWRTPPLGHEKCQGGECKLPLRSVLPLFFSISLSLSLWANDHATLEGNNQQTIKTENKIMKSVTYSMALGEEKPALQPSSYSFPSASSSIPLLCPISGSLQIRPEHSWNSGGILMEWSFWDQEYNAYIIRS